MHNPKWCLFYDVHTMPACPDVGARFDADAFTDRVKACGVDYLAFHARCNLGMAYYNTKVGIRHPSLTHDMFGELADACKRKGIALCAYFNVGLSHEQASLHREWTVLSPEGYTYRPDWQNHFFRLMCYNTGYADWLLETIREVVTGYPIAGLFLDCMHHSPCTGVECIREMKQLGIDYLDPRQVAEFAHTSQVRMAQKIADTAKKLNPDLLLYFNGVSFADQQNIGNYLEIECLPTGGWGYESLPVAVRYARTLGKTVVNMTGRFHKSWGDFGGIRTEASLEYDCLYGIANGMRTTIGDHFHPRGDLNHAVFDLIEGIYTRLQKLNPWLDDAKPLTDLAVVLPKPGFCQVDLPAWERGLTAVKGATRMLCELKAQFDVVSDTADWDKYSVLILPDHVQFDDAVTAKIRRHLARGGKIISSAWSGLDPAKEKFVLTEWGVDYHGQDPFDPAFFEPDPALNAGLPEMPLTLYERGTAFEARPGTEVLGRITAPYYNRHWDGEHGFLYLPPDKPTARPAVTRCGNVIHLSHPLFTIYFNHAPVPMRQLFANLLHRLLPEPLVRTTNLPSFARATVTAQPNRRMVHLLAYVPEHRGASLEMIEEPIEVRDAIVELRCDDRKPKRVHLAPTRKELPFTVTGGYIRTTVPLLRGYALVVVEE